MKAALGVSITCMPFRGSDVSVPALALSKWIPGFDFAFNVVVLAKRSSFPKIIEKVSAAIANVVKRSQVAEQLQKGGVEPVDVSPQQTALAMHLEGLRNSRYEAGVRPHISIAEARRAVYTAFRIKNLVF